jgi:hypothetical protein
MSSLNNSIIAMHVHRPSTAAAFMALTTYNNNIPTNFIIFQQWVQVNVNH